MKMYGSLESVPELEAVALEERKDVLTACRRRVSSAPTALTVGVVMFVVMGLSHLAGVPRGSWPWFASLIVAAFLASWVATQVRARQIRPLLREYLEERSPSTKENP